MSGSYLETVRSQLTRRNELVAMTIARTCRIIDAHTEADSSGVGNPLRTRPQRWNGVPQEYVWFKLLNGEGYPLEQDDVVGDGGRVARHIASAALQFADGINATTAFTVEMQPPNVVGHDGLPLAPNQIADVLGDLENYEDALGRSAANARVTI